MGYHGYAFISFHSEKAWKVPGAETVVLALHHNPAGSDTSGLSMLLLGSPTFLFGWRYPGWIAGSAHRDSPVPAREPGIYVRAKDIHLQLQPDSKPADEVIDGSETLTRESCCMSERVSRERLERQLGTGA
jgi:hypothetical protein